MGRGFRRRRRAVHARAEMLRQAFCALLDGYLRDTRQTPGVARAREPFAAGQRWARRLGRAQRRDRACDRRSARPRARAARGGRRGAGRRAHLPRQPVGRRYRDGGSGGRRAVSQGRSRSSLLALRRKLTLVVGHSGEPGSTHDTVAMRARASTRATRASSSRSSTACKRSCTTARPRSRAESSGAWAN